MKNVTNKTGRATKTKRGKPKKNNSSHSRELVVSDVLGPIDPSDLAGEKAFRLYLTGRTVREVADVLDCSASKAWSDITKMTENLRDISTPEHRAACRELLLRRYGELFRKVEKVLDESIESGNVGAIPALSAVLIKINQEVGAIYGISGELEMGTVVNTARLEEVARRLALVGPHSRARRAASIQAMKLAEIVTPEGGMP